MDLPQQGWRPDPQDARLERYWDGWSWTEYTRPVTQRPQMAYIPAERRPSVLKRLAQGVAVILVGALAFATASVATTGNVLGYAPPWRHDTTGPEVDYPLFGSTDLVQFFERHFIAQDGRIDVSSWASQGVSQAQIEDAIGEAQTQNPYVFTSGATLHVSAVGAVFAVEPTYVYTDAEAERRRAATLEAARAGLATLGVTPQTDPAQAAGLIYDYVVAATTYDDEAAARIDAGSPKEYVAASQEAYGALVDGSAVCTGYAHAFAAMAQQAGLDDVVVTGLAWDGLTNGGHAWNKVRIDGQWLAVDATWGDQGASGDPTYLLMPDGASALATRAADDGWVVDTRLDAYGEQP